MTVIYESPKVADGCYVHITEVHARAPSCSAVILDSHGAVVAGPFSETAPLIHNPLGQGQLMLGSGEFFQVRLDASSPEAGAKTTLRFSWSATMRSQAPYCSYGHLTLEYGRWRWCCPNPVLFNLPFSIPGVLVPFIPRRVS